MICITPYQIIRMIVCYRQEHLYYYYVLISTEGEGCRFVKNINLPAPQCFIINHSLFIIRMLPNTTLLPIIIYC
jgi:hypothetical protein